MSSLDCIGRPGSLLMAAFPGSEGRPGLHRWPVAQDSLTGLRLTEVRLIRRCLFFRCGAPAWYRAAPWSCHGVRHCAVHRTWSALLATDVPDIDY